MLASTLLRERGLKAVDKKQGRIASEGLVASYIHMSPGDPLHPGIELESSALQADSDSLPLSQKESPINLLTRDISYKPDDAICGVSLFAALYLCFGAWAFSSCGAWGLLSSCGAQV